MVGGARDTLLSRNIAFAEIPLPLFGELSQRRIGAQPLDQIVRPAAPQQIGPPDVPRLLSIDVADPVKIVIINVESLLCGRPAVAPESCVQEAAVDFGIFRLCDYDDNLRIGVSLFEQSPDGYKVQ